MRDTHQQQITTAERLMRIETEMTQLRTELSQLRSWLTVVLSEIKTSNEMNRAAIQERAVIDSKRNVSVDHLTVDVAELDKRVKAIEALTPWLKIFVGIGGALGASVVALIWALITGSASIVFR